MSNWTIVSATLTAMRACCNCWMTLKVTTILYASIGIPMALVMFQSMGERMNKFFSLIIRRVRGWLGCSRVDANEIDLILASGTTSMLLIASGATLYHTQEGWSLFDSWYYSFITLSTIGFGDFVALQEGKSLTVSVNINYLHLILPDIIIIGCLLND